MNQSDPIGDMLTRIRNGTLAHLDAIEMPHSNLKAHVARLLKREGFIRDYTSEASGVRKTLRVYLKYAPGRGRESVIRGVRRVSRPGLRHYVAATDMRAVRRGTGIAIVSTSRGLLTDHEARQARVGGELMCLVW